jgi:hypothetical protein
MVLRVSLLAPQPSQLTLPEKREATLPLRQKQLKWIFSSWFKNTTTHGITLTLYGTFWSYLF